MNCCGSSSSPPSQNKSILADRLQGKTFLSSLFCTILLTLLVSISSDDPLVVDRGFNDEWTVIEKADDGFLSVQVHYLLNVESERRYFSLIFHESNWRSAYIII